MEIAESIGKVATNNKSGHSDVPVENVIINKIQVIDQ